MDFRIKDADKIVMTHTGLIPGKKGKVIHVSFERRLSDRRDYAELVLPSRKVVCSEGFDEGELAQLRLYLKGQEKHIVKEAKQINHDLIFKL
ncbi:MAG: hypothetical protein NC337_15830 [Roseburia sp.]|nr:hypothetical protein [Roseburia sp.]